MSLSDSFGDFITRIRNACMAGKKSTYVSLSKMNLGALEVLKSEGFIDGFAIRKKKETDRFDMIRVFLKYNGNDSAIVEIKRVSKPGRKRYSSVSAMKPLYNGFGVYIMSTVKGIVTDYMAKELNVGGEILCSVF